jgi:uncharacterized membrane protein
MKIANKLFVVLLVSLALLSAAAKIMRVPDEMAFFQGVMGFSTTAIVAFGAVQLLSGILLAVPRTRVAGAGLFALTLLMSAAVLLKAGNVPLASFSLLPVLLTGFVIHYRIKTSATERANSLS